MVHFHGLINNYSISQFKFEYVRSTVRSNGECKGYSKKIAEQQQS